MNITRSTVTKYISILVNAKLLYECDRFDMKSKRALKGEKKYYLSDLSFYFCDNTDNRINYGPVLENVVYFYARSRGCSVSVGRIGTLECDFILRNREMDYAYVQVDDGEYRGSYTADSSVFNIPVLLDTEMTVTCCTDDEPKPEETEYTIYLTVDDSGKIPERMEQIRESALNIMNHVTSSVDENNDSK